MEATHGEGASLSENPNLFDVFGLKVRKFKTTWIWINYNYRLVWKLIFCTWNLLVVKGPHDGGASRVGVMEQCVQVRQEPVARLHGNTRLFGHIRAGETPRVLTLAGSKWKNTAKLGLGKQHWLIMKQKSYNSWT